MTTQIDEQVLLISGGAAFLDDVRVPLLDAAASVVFVRSTSASPASAEPHEKTTTA